MQVTRYSTLSRRPQATRIYSERQRKIEQRRRAARWETIKNMLLLAGLVACILAAGYLDGQSIAEGVLLP